jgi:alpha-tubulin suppressor-like RCC1 family protein
MSARVTIGSLVCCTIAVFHPSRLAGQDSLRFTLVAAGARYTCALTTGQRAYCWGDNGEGELGDGTRIDSPAPVAVAGDHTFLTIDAGVEITCGVTTTEEAYCWGRNSTGALGNAATPRSLVPVPVTGGLLFRSVAVGADHVCGLTVDGLAYCWGSNADGQLGTTSDTGTARPLPVPGGLRFGALTAGDSHTCGITVDSLAYCWGSNQRGQLGIGNRSTPRGPQRVAFGRRWRVLSAGSRFTCGVTAERHGVMYCWGDNFHEQINPRTAATTRGDPILWSPTFAGEPLNVRGVSAGRWHTCIVRDGSVNPVSCRGANLDDQLGRNVLGEYLQVSAGDAHTCALRRDGAILCWGRNAAGQLGDGTLYSQLFPVRVIDPVAVQR